MTDTPRWRAAFDTLEKELSPRLQAAMQSEQFAIAVGLAARVRRTFEEQASRTSRRMLHQLNLPAGTDVSRILTEVGQLRQQVRSLQAELDDTREELTVARTAQADRTPKARAKSTRPQQVAGAKKSERSSGSQAKGGRSGPAPRSGRARGTGPAGR